MKNHRVNAHPILRVEERPDLRFYWNKTPLTAKPNEMISSALIANGIKVFGRHHRDGTAQGIFCANGQCSKCLVMANGVPVKSCMTAVRENMFVESVDGLPKLPPVAQAPGLTDIEEVQTDVLVIGGGPAGTSAAIELGERGVRTLIVDDKNELGGKLVLQTHKFFGSVEDSHAGTRGNQIGRMLAQTVNSNPHITVWLNSTVLFIFKDKKVGILKDGAYKLVAPQIILNAAGAREKFLSFPGNSLVGIYGAGAFQTLANRDLVRPSETLFIVGGGNVGLIAGYHALQAGIGVAGLAEVLPECGGYKVHADKLKRLGVPIYTSHTILAANGLEGVESVTIAEVDDSFRPIPGSEKTFACDTILIAVGLSSLDEFTQEAQAAGIPAFAAGDALEIAEASSAMFNGRISGLQVARELGADVAEVPESWHAKAEVLKSHPGKTHEQRFPEVEKGAMPVIHCLQEIPCNPCTTVCPSASIQIEGDPLMGLPVFTGSEGACSACLRCVTICPALAVTLVDYRKDEKFAEVTVPYEVSNFPVQKGDRIKAVDINGDLLGEMDVTAVLNHKKSKTQLVRIKAPRQVAKRIVSFRIQAEALTRPLPEPVLPVDDADAAMLCLCERVTVSAVRALVRKGITDINQIKAVTRAGMGACGSKTCETIVKSVLRQEGVPMERVTSNTKRPVFVEVPLGVLAGANEGHTNG
jgi:NADPH-dependent 2,4-dienoyl-CoA reductase/sulfur reductase-like enzyme/bacterioferritin-associated ferredoxin/Pyruvate/2-oxoacid:ferredoxin oxidoreductase delta subunit